MDDQYHSETLKLSDLGFLFPRFFHPNHWAAVVPLGSFFAVVDGNRASLCVGYVNRWVYRSLGDAADALKTWNGDGQPKGWISAKLDKQALTVWP